MHQFWTLILFFTIYSFFGWLGESIFCSIPVKKFINRGFLNGPFCPVYGFGALLVISILSPLAGNLLVLFAASVLLTSALEYVTGLILEALFHTRYWDYSNQKLNIKGRICLENSLIFGTASVVVVRFVHPALLAAVRQIPLVLLAAAGCGILAYFTVDTVLTARAVFRMNGKLAELQTILDEIRERAHIATLGTVENLQATIFSHLDDSTKARLKTLFERKGNLESAFRAIQRRIIRAFPTMKSLRSNESLQRMKEIVRSRSRWIRKK